MTTPKPLLDTDEPLCQFGEYACADRTCLPAELFCDGHVDCNDGSDEGWCGKWELNYYFLFNINPL